MLTRSIGATLVLACLLGGAWYLLGAGSGTDAPGTTAGGGSPAAGRGGAGGGPGGGRSREALVVVRTVTEARVDGRLESIGDGEAIASVTVVPREAGVLTDVAVDSGQRVAAGDTIAALDDDAETVGRDIAAREVEDAAAARDRAARLVSSRAGPRTDLDAAENALARATLALREAELRLDRRTVTAPISGAAGLVEVERGDRVTAETPLVTIDDRDALRIEFRVPERFAGRVRVGQRVRAGSFALPGREFAGEVVAVGGRVERDSRALPVRARVDNADDLLRPGMSFTVRLEFEGERLPAVDPLAVQWDSAGAFVWRVETADGASRAARVPVRIVQRNPESVLVGGDLAPGDPVVTEGVLSVREGAAVRVAGAPRGGADESRPEGGREGGGGGARPAAGGDS